MFDKETITSELQNRIENAKPRDSSSDIREKLNEVIENQEYEYDEDAGVPVPVDDGDEDDGNPLDNVPPDHPERAQADSVVDDVHALEEATGGEIYYMDEEEMAEVIAEQNPQLDEHQVEYAAREIAAEVDSGGMGPP